MKGGARKGAGAPVGNSNCVGGKLWQSAVKRAICRRANGTLDHGLDDLADKFIASVALGDLAAFKELADRLDGRAAQQVIVAGDEDGGPIKTYNEIALVAIDAVDGRVTS